MLLKKPRDLAKDSFKVVLVFGCPKLEDLIICLVEAGSDFEHCSSVQTDPAHHIVVWLLDIVADVAFERLVF